MAPWFRTLSVAEADACLDLPTQPNPEADALALEMLDKELGRLIDLRHALDAKAAGVPIAIGAIGALLVPRITITSAGFDLALVFIAGAAALVAILFSVAVLHTGLLLTGPRLEVAVSATASMVQYRRSLVRDHAAVVLAGLDDAATRTVRLNLAIAALAVLVISLILLAVLGGIR